MKLLYGGHSKDCFGIYTIDVLINDTPKWYHYSVTQIVFDEFQKFLKSKKPGAALNVLKKHQLKN